MRRSTRVSAGLAVLLVLATGSALFSAPERVSASDDTVTTVLQPGWNLAGWTEHEVPVSAIFEAIPQLEVAYAWDAEDQRFRLAVRADARTEGDLRTLTPGMGLVLWVGGDDQFVWTRLVSAHAADAPLHQGWNVAVWVGEDGVPAGEALQDVNRILTTAKDADGREIRSLRRGEAFWLNVSATREWWQPAIEEPVYELPRIEFSGEFSSGDEEAIRSEVEDVVAYFARRFGIWVPDLTIQFEEVSQFGTGLSTCGTYHAKRIRLLGEGCFDVLAHEYAHAIQDKLGRTDPNWLAEGVANRWEDQYAAHTGTVTYAERLANTVMPISQMIQAPLLEYWNQGPFGTYTPEGYFLAQLGTEFLADTAGEQSLYDFFALLDTRESWHEAFAESFGVSIYTFSEQFEDYREEVAPRYRTITGRVIGADSKPVAGVFVESYIIDPSGRTYVNQVVQSSGFDGRFSVAAPGGAVALEVICPHSGGGWYAGAEGISLDPDDITPVLASSRSSPEVVIRIPVTQAEAEQTPCSTASLISYTVLGTDGEPLSGIGLNFGSARVWVFPKYRTTSQDGVVEFPVGQSGTVYAYGDPETGCPAERAYENSVILGRVDFGGDFYPSQNWLPPLSLELTKVPGVEAQGVDNRTIVITFPEDCP